MDSISLKSPNTLICSYILSVQPNRQDVFSRLRCSSGVLQKCYCCWFFVLCTCAMAAVQNISFIKGIEAAVYKKPVICFIKCYDKAFCGNVRAHTALKVYLQAEALDDVDKNADSLIVSEGNSSKIRVTVQDTASDQLFSPTTKNILEEISDMSSHDESASSLPTVKRALFHPKESQVSTEPSMKTSMQNVPSRLNVDTVEKPLQSASEVNLYTINAVGIEVAASFGLESPIKKSKSKEKEC